MKLFNKITLLSAGAALAIGGGVVAIVNNSAIKVNADSVVSVPIELTTTGGTSASACTVNGLNGIKAGTGKVDGAVVVNIPSNASKVTFYIASWKATADTALSIEATNCTVAEGTSITVSADDGVSNNSPFTLTGEAENFKKEISFSAVDDNATIKLSGPRRFVIWSAEAQAAGDPSELTGVSIDKNLVVVKSGTSTEKITASPIPETAQDVNYQWSSKNTSVATIASNGTITGVGVGATEVSVLAYQDDPDEGFSKDAKVVVTANAGSAENAFSLDDAVLVAETTGTKATTNEYYVEGIVSNLSISNGQVTFDIVEGEKIFKVYKVYNSDGTATVTASDIHNGDTAVVSGKIFNYNGTTPETQYGRLVSVTSNVTLSSIAITGTVTKEVFVGEDFDVSELKVMATYSDATEADVTSKATITVDPVTATTAGTQDVTVTASFEGLEVSKTVSITVNALALGETKINLSIADYATENSWVNSTQYTTIEKSGLRITAAPSAVDGTLTNTGKYYTSGNQWRLYQGESPVITFSSLSSEKVIKSITVTYASDKTGILLDADGEQVASGTTVDVNAGSYSFTIGNTSSSVSNGQVRVTNIEVILDSATEVTAADVAAQIKVLAGNSWENHVATSDCENKYATAKQAVLGLSSAELEVFKTSTDTEIASARAAYETWCARNHDDNPYSGSVVTSTRAIAMNADSSIMIVAIAIASISLLGAALILRKKKLAK